MTTEEDLLQEDLIGQPAVYTSYGPFPERRKRMKLVQAIAVSSERTCGRTTRLDKCHRTSYGNSDRVWGGGAHSRRMWHNLCVDVFLDMLYWALATCSWQTTEVGTRTSTKWGEKSFPQFASVSSKPATLFLCSVNHTQGRPSQLCAPPSMVIDRTFTRGLSPRYRRL